MSEKGDTPRLRPPAVSLVHEPPLGTPAAMRDLRGTIKLTCSNVFSDSTVSGTIDGQQIVLGVMWEGAKEATFSGKLDGESISGEWDCPAINDEGVWFGRLRAPASGP